MVPLEEMECFHGQARLRVHIRSYRVEKSIAREGPKLGIREDASENTLNARDSSLNATTSVSSICSISQLSRGKIALVLYHPTISIDSSILHDPLRRNVSFQPFALRP